MAVPAVAAGKAAGEELGKFWASFLKAAASPAFEVSTVRRGKKKVSRTVHVPMVQRTTRGKGKSRETETRVRVPWIVPVVVAAAGGLAYSAEVLAFAKSRGFTLPSLPSPSSKAQSLAQTLNPLNVANYDPFRLP